MSSSSTTLHKYTLAYHSRNLDEPDIEVQLGKTIFLLHRRILMQHSDYFARILSDVKQQSRVTLKPDLMSDSIFEFACKWMYNSSALIDLTNISEIVEAADVLELRELSRHCQNFLDQLVASGDSVQPYRQAIVDGSAAVADREQRHLRSRISELVEDERYLQLSPQELYDLLSSDHPDLSREIEVLGVIVSWLLYDWIQRSQYTNELLECIRISSLGVPEVLDMLTRTQNNFRFECSSAITEIFQKIMYIKERSEDDPCVCLKRHLLRKRCNMRSAGCSRQIRPKIGAATPSFHQLHKQLVDIEMQKKQQRHSAAILIQAAFRGYSTRCTLAMSVAAAICIQSLFRGFLARRLLLRRMSAILTLQGAFRNFLSRRERSKRLAATITIQAAVRGHLTRRSLFILTNCVVTIQRAERTWQLNRLRTEAAVIIQKNVRCEIALRHYRTLRDATIFLQCVIRSWAKRRKRQLEHAAILIQAYFRGWQARKNWRMLVAVMTVQSWWLQITTRRRWHNMRCGFIRLQALVRGNIVRQRHREAKLAAVALQKEYSAAVMLQCRIRGFITRRHLATKVVAALGLPSRFLCRYSAPSSSPRATTSTAVDTIAKIPSRSSGYRQSKQSLRIQKAATVIQSWFRGYRVRYDLKYTVPKVVRTWNRSSTLIISGVNPLKEDDFNAGRRILRLDKEKNRWEHVGYVPEPVKQAGFVFHDCKICVIGGWHLKHEKTIGICQMLKPLSRNWSNGPPLLTARRYHAACSVGPLIVVLGGINDKNELLDTVEIYSRQSGGWRLSTSRLANATAALAACVHRNRIWFCGGLQLRNGEFTTVDDVHCYIPEKDRIFNMSFSLQLPRAFAALTCYEHTMYLIGGSDGHQGALNIESFDEGSTESVVVGRLLEARKNLCATVCGKSIVVLGGQSDDTTNAPIIVEACCRQRAVFNLPALPQPLVHFGLVVVPAAHI